MNAEILSQLAHRAIAMNDTSVNEEGFPYIEPQLKTELGPPGPLSKAIEQSRRVLVVGSAGSGKTTLLRHQAAASGHAYLRAPRRNPSPVWISARLIELAAGRETIESAIRGECERGANGIGGAELAELLRRSSLLVYVDGLDEARDGEYVAVQLTEFLLRFPNLSVVASSRAGAFLRRLDNLTQYELGGWSVAQVKNFIDRLPEKNEREIFRLQLERPGFEKRAFTPLILSLLWRVFLVHGALPQNAGALYEVWVETMLRQWESQKGGDRSQLTFEQLLSIFDTLALHSLSHSQVSFSLQAVRQIIRGVGPEIPLEDAITELTRNVIFHQGTSGLFSFAHRSLVDFFASRALRYRPHDVLEQLGADIPDQVLDFTRDVLVDVSPIIRAAVAQKLFSIAAKFIAHRSVGPQLSAFVLEEFAQEFGDQFVALIKERPAATGAKPTESASFSLLERYYASRNLRLANHARGKEFETFAEEFFGSVFKIVSRNVRTNYGELDLIVEIATSGPFWAAIGTDALIECKNWNTGTPISDVNEFIGKHSSTRVRLAFFVSASGFTKDAMERFIPNASNPLSALLVPITGEDIEGALKSEIALDEFFKKCIRRIQYLQKF